MARLFIGISPDRAARAALAESARLLGPLAPGRYADPSLYHITLAFLGELDAGRVPAIRAAMRAAETSAPFRLALGPVGTFGPILWRGIQAKPALDSLADALRDALDAASLPYDRKPLRAHITLARDAALTPAAREVALPDAAFTVRTLILFESVRAAGTLQYRPRAEVPLS